MADVFGISQSFDIKIEYNNYTFAGMMTKLFYFLLILPLSLLPYPLLYLLSDIIFLIMYISS